VASIGAETCRAFLGYWLDRVAAGEDVVVTRRGKPMARLTAAAPAVQPVPAAVPRPVAAPPLAAPPPVAPPLAEPPLLTPPVVAPPLATPPVHSPPAGEADAA
jgi:prevent-host-death family protein